MSMSAPTATTTYLVYLLPEEDGRFSVFAADLPGCVSQGDTEEEALANIQEAFAGCLAAYKDQGRPVPWEEGDTLRWAAEEGIPATSLLPRRVTLRG
jgi:antitoxin HicB